MLSENIAPETADDLKRKSRKVFLHLQGEEMMNSVFPLI